MYLVFSAIWLGDFDIAVSFFGTVVFIVCLDLLQVTFFKAGQSYMIFWLSGSVQEDWNRGFVNLVWLCIKQSFCCAGLAYFCKPGVDTHVKYVYLDFIAIWFSGVDIAV